MKVLTTVFLFGIFTVTALGMDKVIYGVDNRQEVFEAPSFYADWARSTAAMMTSDKIKKGTDGNYKIHHNPSLGQSFGLCENERFVKEPTTSDCSGFLVGPDLIATAGHCIEDKKSCKGFYWVFDYRVERNGTVKDFASGADVYPCKEVITTVLDKTTKQDYALIRLDRPVVGRKPLPVRLSEKVSEQAELVAIGHPSGLPTKIADRGSVRTNDQDIYFVANLDTFVGNSGSVVLDAKTGLVEGILVRGAKDYAPDAERGCNVANVCAEGTCRGEDVTRISQLLSILKPLISK